MESSFILERPCTKFCAKLKALQRVDGKLPSYDDLVAQLGGPKGQRCSSPLGTLEELQQRDACNLCRLVSSTLFEYRYVIDPDQQISILLYPEEQAFRLSYPSFIDTRLAFVAEGDHEASGPDNARPVRASELSPTLVRRWLRTCQEKHRQTCGAEKQTDIGPDPDSDQFVFRVVDIELGCVRRVPLETEYVCLSYVWGQLQMLKLNKGNLDTFMTPGSLEMIRENLPKTLNDAIDFLQTNGLRYLWIDTLCLVQDDPEDVSIGVNLMGSIYLNSLFTIIAGSGTDANTGLIGVQPLSRSSTQFIVDIAPDLRMTATHNIDWHLSRSIYNQRGWTCQELVLPRRAVIFINNTVYFRCQSANWSEETTSDHPSWGDSWLDPDDFNISRIPSQIEGANAAWWAYQKLNEDYSRRELRFDSDTLRAVAGMARPLAKQMDTCMLQGLPVRYLDNALLFMSSTGDMRRRPGFASYSWAGWAGRVMWPRENYTWSPENGDDEGMVPQLSDWMHADTMVTWAVKTPDDKVYALSSFKKFRRSISMLEGLMKNLPGISSENEIEKLKTAGFGHLCYLTADDMHYHNTFDLENRSTNNLPSTKEMENMTTTDSEFNTLFENGMEDEDQATAVKLSIVGQQEPWMDNPGLHRNRLNRLASIHARRRRAKLVFREHMATNAAANEQQTEEPEETTLASARAAEMGSLAKSGSMIKDPELEDMSYIGALRVLEKHNRTVFMLACKERDNRIAQARAREAVDGAPSSAPSSAHVFSTHTTSVDRIGDPEPGRPLWATGPSSQPPQQSIQSPFPLLYFQTISFKLILGERKHTSSSEGLHIRSTKEDQNGEHPPTTTWNDWAEAHNGADRALGTPLLSPAGRLVGSLHLDTRDGPQPDAAAAAAAAPTFVECLVIARCSAPTFGSALREGDVGGRPLLWVLHVVASGTREGVVERRGVGQVLVEALEETAGGGGRPEIKTVLLG